MVTNCFSGFFFGEGDEKKEKIVKYRKKNSKFEN